ncbi:hypothetical protein AJ80_06049 [Polytolypa hystricis UAMH7299]|uniref:Inclusion body clearance protein IML2 n=1 Tax=Polytolypa hystricis (strain UAMH7299) TaxID=1447883 RepID=A0A2B7XYT1_POLH7|nr:hypothetical protein AJ80_06049 [Polytolypa hystricis UAMH7299]
MDDDVDSAEEGLKDGTSSFHKLGKGVVAFVRATLGFEQDIMRHASERLAEAETSAYNDQHKATHNAHARNAYRSSIYAPGSEYLLCQSMAQLMAAVVGMLNESLTESIRAFYKLRKAYIALDGLMQMEEKFLREQASKNMTSSTTSLPVSGQSTPVKAHPSEVGASTKPSPLENGVLPGKKSSSGRSIGTGEENFDKLDEEIEALTLAGTTPLPANVSSSTVHLTHDPDHEILSNPVDAFVHSGANLCFGVLLLLISLVPPAFSKLLYIVGFKGDRGRGLRMLWQASKFNNLNGAIAGLALLAFYNGFIRNCEILPDPSGGEEDIENYPGEKLTTLLSEMRTRFPNSQLWVLEESRMQGANKNLDNALELLCSGKKSPLKQVEALHVFEKSLDAMYLHKYELCAQSFIECAELNSWSRALYYYIAASSHLALYRDNAQSSPSVAKKHAEEATALFRKAPSQAGKKRFMARQLPFDIFVSRKVAKWEARAKEWNVDLVDAIGVNPIEEMIYFWNGHSRMTEAQLEESLKSLAWSEGENNKTWQREGTDERAILALLRAAVFRSLGRYDQAKEVLRSQILAHDKSVFKGQHKDDWTCPTAHYEMAANLWMERHSYQSVNASGTANGIVPASSRPGTSSSRKSTTSEKGSTKAQEAETPEVHDRRKVHECKEWLDKVSKWEAYELDARVGLKVATAEETVRKWQSLHP